MTETSFIDKLANEIIVTFPQGFNHLTIILPNRRARVFLIEALRKRINRNLFAPTIISIEDFITDISGIRSLDNTELLFLFYIIYQETTNPDEVQPFEKFAGWAKILLQDFNEIDRYLLEPNSIFSYLEAIEDLKHWSLDPDQRTVLIENYLYFWKQLPVYYNSLYKHLVSKGIGYQGLIYREAIANLQNFTNRTDKNRQYIFAGFNALNKAEEIIIQQFLALGNTQVFWDIDSVFLKDEEHDASFFIKRFKSVWSYYKSHDFNWIDSSFSEAKEINIIGTPKSIGQAKIVGEIIADILSQESTASLNRTAVVLAEENLLLPVLHALPLQTGPLNITMGYSAKNSPAQLLISKLFKLHVNALTRNASGYVFYYKDILDILRHPLIEPYVFAGDVIKSIISMNYTFIPQKTLCNLSANNTLFFDLLFSKWSEAPLDVLERLKSILLIIKERLNTEIDQEKVTLAMVYSIFKHLNKISSYYSNGNQPSNLETLRNIYKETIDLAEVSFEGEPLQGLQVMGVLESRVLDFDTVIITSVNEGSFPAGKAGNSFIPYDVKREKELPTFKEKDAIYTYHFYHLLQRAKRIFLIYNTESEGIDAGEKSRFLTQLEIEPQPLHFINKEVRHAVIPLIASRPVEIQKTDKVLARLREMAVKGFSPSAITAYIRNPIDFYFKKILRIRESDEVEESIAVNTLGTIIHGTLENLFRPFIDQKLTADSIHNCRSRLDDEIRRQFEKIYREGEVKKGRNLLAYEVAKRHIQNFLKQEEELLSHGDEVTILALEHNARAILEHKMLPYPIVIAGNIDRIERRNGRIRIIDYKTGKVEQRNMKLLGWDGFGSDIKHDKIIQVLAYAFMYFEHAKGEEIEVGILSFKNLKSGFLPFIFESSELTLSTITPQLLQSYLDALVEILAEIVDPELPFLEKS